MAQLLKAPLEISVIARWTSGGRDMFGTVMRAQTSLGGKCTGAGFEIHEQAPWYANGGNK